MEEKVFNQDEIELLELLEFVLCYHAKAAFTDEAKLKEGDTVRKECEVLKNQIIETANTRYESHQELLEKKKIRLKDYYDEGCTYCGFYSSFQPNGEAEGDYGFRFYTFRCAKCGKDFLGQLPVDDHDTIVWHDIFLKEISKKDKRGNFTSKKFNVTQEKIDTMIEHFNFFKEKVLICDRNEKVHNDFLIAYNLDVTKQLLNLREIKKKITGEIIIEDIN
jgi:hypothetical protein